MADNFYLSGLDNGRWFGKNSESYVLFGYVGDRECLLKELESKSMLRQLLEIFVPRVKIGSLLKILTGYDLGKAASDTSLAKEIFDLLAKEENRRTLTEHLRLAYERGKKKGTYFDRVSKSEYKKTRLFDADRNMLEGRLVTVEGHLVHRTTVVQYSKPFDATLRASTGEWVLADFPPHALVSTNSSFKGNVVLLTEDPGFTKAFQKFLPFSTEIGWYPYVRITGIYTSARLATEKLPSLSIALVEYRPPRKFLEVRVSLLAFAEREIRGKKNYLDDWSDLILFSYLAPIIFNGSNLKPGDADEETSSVLRNYHDQTSKDVPQGLSKFYQSLP